MDEVLKGWKTEAVPNSMYLDPNLVSKGQAILNANWSHTAPKQASLTKGEPES